MFFCSYNWISSLPFHYQKIPRIPIGWWLFLSIFSSLGQFSLLFATLLVLKSQTCVICCILEPKSLICVLFAAFWSLNLSDLRAICCVFELKYLILHAICSISELKSQIWVAKIVNLHDNCNIFSSHSFSKGFQRCLDGFHRFLDRLQWSFRGFNHSLGFLLGFLRA